MSWLQPEALTGCACPQLFSEDSLAFPYHGSWTVCSKLDLLHDP